MRITVGINARGVDLISGAMAPARRTEGHQVKALPFAVLAIARPSFS